MNKALRLLTFSLALSLAAFPGAALAQNHPAGPPPQTRPALPAGRTLTTPPRPVSPSKQEVKTESGEQFFIIASIDRQNSQLLLKRPTEVTLLAKIASTTKYFGDNGEATTLGTFRAGDTVWAKLSGSGPEPTLIEMREGEMTVADLHKYYLDYSIIK
jgi:nucleoid-associated protein YgaU